MKISSDTNWITEIQSRAVSTHTRHYKIDPNESYDSREAKIIFYNTEDETIADTVSIYQMYKEAFIVAKEEYQVEAEGGILSFNVSSNVGFNISVSDGWIKQVETRGLTETQLTFSIEENSTEVSRTGFIFLSSEKIRQEIKISQYSKKPNNPDGNIDDMPNIPW